MRIGDCVQLEDAKIVNGQITIRTTKTGQRVSIPLHPEARAALEKVKNENRPSFRSGEGTLKSGASAWERTTVGERRSSIRGAAVLGNSPKMVEKGVVIINTPFVQY
jgi:integrase